MKKISLLAIAFIVGITAQAQEKESDQRDFKPVRTAMETQPRFGLRAGVNMSWLNIDDEDNATNYEASSSTSFHGGLFVNVPIGDKFRFQPELSYTRFGSKIDGQLVTAVTASNQKYEIDLHYIAVPLMFQVQSSTGFFLEAGPQIAFLTTAEQDVTNGTDGDVKDYFGSLDWALNAGVGYTTRIGVGVNVRYVHSLSNAWDTEDAPTGTPDRDISNRAFQFGLTYHFGAHK